MSRMEQTEVDAIRDTIREAKFDDRALIPDSFNHTFDLLVDLATTPDECSCYPGGFSPDTYEGPQPWCREHGDPRYLATQALRRLARRAATGVPFDEPEDHL